MKIEGISLLIKNNICLNYIRHSPVGESKIIYTYVFFQFEN